jgi:hypothetical protein
MVGTEDFSSPDEDLSSSETPLSVSSISSDYALEISDAIDRVLIEAWPSLENLLSTLHGLELPSELRLALFGVIGRYTHTFSVARMNHNLSIEAAHMTAQNAVLGDPRVMSFIEGMMSSGVDQMVSRLV